VPFISDKETFLIRLAHRTRCFSRQHVFQSPSQQEASDESRTGDFRHSIARAAGDYIIPHVSGEAIFLNLNSWTVG
jgi:hypothetical protein